jgi:hypothetical protein
MARRFLEEMPTFVQPTEMSAGGGRGAAGVGGPSGLALRTAVSRRGVGFGG